MTVGELRRKLSAFRDDAEIKMQDGTPIDGIALHLDDESLRLCAPEEPDDAPA